MRFLRSAYRSRMHRAALAGFGILVSALTGTGGAAEQPAPDFQVPPGFQVELVAAPPLVEQPMHASFDEQGRLLVADSLGINPTGELLSTKPSMVIRLLEDTDGDGRFDKSTVLADKLVFPEGVLWHQGSVFTASPPSLWRLDHPGDAAAERRTQLATGWVGTGITDDLHGPALGPDGRIYWACGRFAHEIRQPDGPIISKGLRRCCLRCRPDGSDFEILCGLQGNPVKQAFTDEGEIFTSGTWSKGPQGRNDVVVHCIEGGNYPQLDGDFYSPEFQHTPDLLPALISFGPASASGMMRYRSATLGAEYRDNLFVALFNMHKVTRHVLARDGGTFRATTEEFLTSTNNDFRPSDVIEDADGSLLVINTGTWSNGCRAFRAGGQPKVQGSIYRVRRTSAAGPADPRTADRLAPPHAATACRKFGRPAVRRSRSGYRLPGGARGPIGSRSDARSGRSWPGDRQTAIGSLDAGPNRHAGALAAILRCAGGRRRKPASDGLRRCRSKSRRVGQRNAHRVLAGPTGRDPPRGSHGAGPFARGGSGAGTAASGPRHERRLSGTCAALCADPHRRPPADDRGAGRSESRGAAGCAASRWIR